MARFVRVPVERLSAATLQSLLEEFASRDGTDYGVMEKSLVSKVDSLNRQLQQGLIDLVYDLDSDHYDLLDQRGLAALDP